MEGSMPFPFLLGAAAVIAGATGVGAGVYGASKMKDAKNTMELAQRCHKENTERYERTQEETSTEMDKLGTLEMEILKSFGHFSDLIERIQNRPNFNEINRGDSSLPSYNPQHLREVSIGAGVLLGSLGGAAVGTAGGMAAAGGVSMAVMALGSASTGTAIASLSGVAATNATLAVLGGGTLAAGGGGVALGSTLLSAATLGVGLMVGGAIFAFTGSKLSEKADEAWSQMRRAEEKINTICTFLEQLKTASISYMDSLYKTRSLYSNHISFLEKLLQREANWNLFSEEEKKNIRNLVYLVSLLYAMCKENLVIKNEDNEGINSVNMNGIDTQIKKANTALEQISAA